MSRKEVEISEPQCLRHYDAGFKAGEISMSDDGWVSIEDQAPEEKVPLLYFFECTGVSAGYYYGIEEDYCPETGHHFGGESGWLIGDVTHWQYYPEAPVGFESSPTCFVDEDYIPNFHELGADDE